jgi:hypothetical protein
MLELVNASVALISFLRDLKTRFLSVAIVKNSKGEDVLANHLLPNSLLRELIHEFLRTTYISSRPPPPAGTDVQRAILDDWLAREAQGEPVPELFLAASNITSSRLTAFAIASQGTITALARHGVWTVDMMSRVPITESILWPKPNVENQSIADATVTSAAYPLAFPPVKWNLRIGRGGGQLMDVRQTFIDGGLLDNSPLDLAIVAGATHVLSIELGPLINFLFAPIDNAEYDAPAVLFQSFTTAMDGNMHDRIAAVIADNTGHGTRDPLVQIYRLAPLTPAAVSSSVVGTFSPGVVNFDGVFDDNHQLKMSLYDWFIQGYTDAKGLDATSFAADLIVIDYEVGKLPSPRAYVGTARPGGQAGNTTVSTNKFWRASSQAWPTQLPA